MGGLIVNVGLMYEKGVYASVKGESNKMMLES
jgi:hypothetical protein